MVTDGTTIARGRGDGRHNDGKGQHDDRQFDNGNGPHGNAARRHGTTTARDSRVTDDMTTQAEAKTTRVSSERQSSSSHGTWQVMLERRFERWWHRCVVVSGPATVERTMTTK